MEWKSWTAESRLNYGNKCNENGPTCEALQVGCLMRIAKSLERIEQLLDPVKRKEIRAKATAADDRERFWDAWRNILPDRAWEVTGKAVRRYFYRLKLAPKEKVTVDRIDNAVYAWIRGDDFWDHAKVRMPTEAEKEATIGRFRSFDPETFDWSQLELSRLQADRLADFLKRLQELKDATSTPAPERTAPGVAAEEPPTGV